MLAKQKHLNSIFTALCRASWTLLLLISVVAAAEAQTGAKKGEPPVFQDYKGVKIGMVADEVRLKLGKAQSDDKDGFLYVFENDETAQILLGADMKVRTISVMFGSDCSKQPKFEEIFGKKIEPEQQEGGGLKMIKYVSDGYWLSYNRNPGEKPAVTVVMQKMP